MERCNSLVLQAPSVIELRNSANGAPEYRELNLEGSFDAAKWTPVTGENTGAEGWQPAVNFLRMNFNPPLTDAIPKTGSCFLAYASTDVVNTADEDRINSMKANFNDESGTFEWNGRSYQYATSYALPCYRLP
ncbi:MAG TPA: hypothetical protein VMU16_14805 [Candidatus Binataceae bacterium]|nr:hypothetical protein [Candidatus Binataceae bacterium]